MSDEMGFNEQREHQSNVVKPPLGLMPRYIWLEKRRVDIEGAISRYKDVEKKVPLSWFTELEEIKVTIRENKLKINFID
jgi:hypothetical protein